MLPFLICRAKSFVFGFLCPLSGMVKKMDVLAGFDRDIRKAVQKMTIRQN